MKNKLFTDPNDFNKETEDEILFYTPSFYQFDNFSAHSVEIWRHNFPTSEHAYQWRKFNPNSDVAKNILTAKSPGMTKLIAHQNEDQMDKSWDNIKVSVMREILKAKADQHEDVREKLKLSGTRKIIENSPTDIFWGNGPNNDGQSMLGKIWMEIRRELFG